MLTILSKFHHVGLDLLLSSDTIPGSQVRDSSLEETMFKPGTDLEIVENWLNGSLIVLLLLELAIDVELDVSTFN